MSVFTVIGILIAAVAVYRICKKCWRSTPHDVFDDYGTKVYRCRECGESYRMEDK